MVKKSLEIHSENILPIIKKWLYSERDIFVRELVSNACDALHKVKLLRDRGEVVLESDDELKVEIHIDKEARTLTFTDTGIGMDADEVQKYIAQIAFSGAEDFINKYEGLGEKEPFIGHFGLGFYSAYMVASKVTIDTLSYKAGAKPVFWSCDGSSEYELEEGSRAKRGTTIILHLGTENEEFLDAHHLGKTLEHYCSFLPYPIYLGTRHINSQLPLWVKNPSECSKDDYLEFYRYLYPMESDPLFWVHLNVDYPFHLKGILYFPKIKRDFDLDKSSVKLFCNRVFVSDSCKEVIPHYLAVLRGVVDSPDIPLNVSRSYLQMDKTVRQLGNHISKKVSDSLSSLYAGNRDRFIEIWDDVSPIVKLGVLEDDKFYDRVKEFLLWKNTDGQWTTVEEYLERNNQKISDKVLYTQAEHLTSPFLALYRQRGIEVLCTNARIDPYAIQALERKLTAVKFQRIDGALDETLLDPARENVVLDSEGKTAAGRLTDFVRRALGLEGVEVEAKSLATDALPAVVILDESQRRMRDYFLMSGQEGLGAAKLLGKQKLVVNTNSPLIQALPKLDQLDTALAKELVHQTYELALLAQREIDPALLEGFIARTQQVIERLAMQATQK